MFELIIWDSIYETFMAETTTEEMGRRGMNPGPYQGGLLWRWCLHPACKCLVIGGAL